MLWAENGQNGPSEAAPPLSLSPVNSISHPSSPTEAPGWSTQVTFFSFENWQSFFVYFSLLSPLSPPDIKRPASLFYKFDFSTYFDSSWWQAITQHWDIHTSSLTTLNLMKRIWSDRRGGRTLDAHSSLPFCGLHSRANLANRFREHLSLFHIL